MAIEDIKATESQQAAALVGLEDEFGIDPTPPQAPTEGVDENPANQNLESTPEEEVADNTLDLLEGSSEPTDEVPPVENAEESSEESEKPAEEEESSAVTNPMFGDKDLSIKPETKEENTEVTNDFDSILKEVGVKDGNELKEKLSQYQAMEPEFQSLKEQNEGFEKTLQSLPPELYQAMKASLKGEDWRGIVNSTPALDFNKSVDEVDEQKLVNTIMPDKFTAEEWEEYNDEDGDPSIKKAIGLAVEISKGKFTEKQNEFKNSVVAEQNKSKEYQEKFTQSLNQSNEFVKKAMPGITDEYLNKINQSITKEGIVSQFYNQDGTLKETAVLAILKTTPEYDDYQRVLRNNAVTEAKNKTMQEVLERGNSTPNIRSNTNSSKNAIRPEVQAKIDEINDLMS